MKIVCDKCQTKYSIADEKVSGKVFKIRCKKCSHIIVVKGTEAAAEPAAPEGDEGATVAGSAAAPLGDAGDKVWFLVVAGEQVGPFSGAEVRARFAAGEVDAETYSWREGFGDWLRLASIDDFRDLGAAANGAANGGETRRTDVGDMFAAHAAATQDDDGGAADIFGGAAARSAGGRAAAAAPAPADDPFQGGRSSGDARSRGAASAGAAAAQNDSKLTGQRNENSMLFSLNNLTAMATSGNAARSPSPSSSSPAPEARPGYATARNEGSGLIDIRAMAAATLSSSNGPSSSSLANDIPSFSAAPVFTPVVAAPVMMPVPQQGGLPKWAFALIGVGGLAFLGLGAGVIALLLKKDPPQVAVAPPVAAPVVAMAPTVAPTTPVAPAAGGTPVAAAAGGVAGAAVAANGTPGGDAAKPAAAEHKAGGKAHDKPAPTRGGKPGAASPAIPQPVRPPEPTRVAAAEKPRGKKSDGLDDLLNDAAPPTRAAKARPAAEPPPPADDPSMPDQLDKSDVQGGMSGVKASVMACYGQFHVPGVALTSVTINKGRVTSATVGGALAGTPTGDCVEKAVKKASFKKAKQSLTVQYPFVLR